MPSKLITAANDVSSTIARVTLGIVIFPHGAQHALGWFGGAGFGGTIDYFGGVLGIPAFLTVLVIMAELLGSLALILGLLSRAAAAGIALVMLGAVFTVHLENGFFMNWTGMQAGEGVEYHILALGLAIIIMLRGSGAFSIDRMLAARSAGDGA